MSPYEVKGVIVIYPLIYLSVRPDGWDRDLYIELDLPEQLSAKYLNKGRSQKVQIDTSEVLAAIASTGVYVNAISDVLYVYQRKEANTHEG